MFTLKCQWNFSHSRLLDELEHGVHEESPANTQASLPFMERMLWCKVRASTYRLLSFAVAFFIRKSGNITYEFDFSLAFNICNHFFVLFMELLAAADSHVFVCVYVYNCMQSIRFKSHEIVRYVRKRKQIIFVYKLIYIHTRQFWLPLIFLLLHSNKHHIYSAKLPLVICVINYFSGDMCER